MTGSDIKVPRLPVGHPRVFLRKEEIPLLRKKIKRPKLADAYAAYRSRLSEKADGSLPDPSGARYTNADSHKLGVIECYAFSYLLDEDEARGRAAIDAMLTYHREIVHYDYNTQGQELFTIGLVYDWCYPLLSDREKDVLFRAAEQTAHAMEMGYPVFGQGAVTGHGSEGQVLRDLMTVAVAMADERPELYARTAKLFFSDFTEAKKYFYTFGAYPQGTHYISYRMQWEYLATRLWGELGVDHVFGERQKDPLYWFLYLRRGDGRFLYDGDDHKTESGTFVDMYRTFFHGANLEGDGYLLTEAENERPQKPFAESKNQSLGAVEYLLAADPDLKPLPLDDLPLSRYFGSPRGELIARTGWGFDAVVCQMKIGEIYTANHQHLDAGAFQIAYHGYLATDSGYYQAQRSGDYRDPASGNTEYGSQHFLSYTQRTVAHNCMLVFDPAEKFAHCDRTDLANDGGQRYPNHAREARRLEDLLDPARGHRVGNVLSYAIGEGENPSYSYLKGDLAPAYTEKVKKYQRSFVFLPLAEEKGKAALVVYDRIESADASFRKTWLLHTLGKPDRKGDTYHAADPREGCTGELTLKTLLPKKSQTRILGGEDLFLVDGVRYLGKVVTEGPQNEGGGYRLEVSPKTAKKADVFLHVIGVGDAKATDIPSKYLSTATHEGAIVGKNAVLFAKSDLPSGKPFTVKLPKECRMLLVADLLPGAYTVNGEKASVGESGVLALREPAPVCVVKRKEKP